MKILFVLENYYPHIGGVETLFQNLAETLAKKGYQITILTSKAFKDYKDFEIFNNVNIFRIKVPSFAQRYFFTMFAIFKSIKLAKQHDIIHTTTYNAALPAWIAAKLIKKKSIITIHEVWDKKWFIMSGQNKIKSAIFYLIEKFILKLKFDMHICVSNSTLSDFKKLFPHRIAQTIYNGLDYTDIDYINQTYTNKLDLKKTYGYYDNDFVILSFGRPGISKGFDYLVDAIPDIVSKISNVKFIFIWSTNANFISLRDKLVNKINSYNLNDKIKIEQGKEKKELFKYIKMSDCIIIPSLSEGFGYAVVESCALQSNIVATNTTSIPEVISGKYILCTPADSKSISECVYQMYLGNYIQKPIKRFEINQMVDEYEKIYKIFDIQK